MPGDGKKCIRVLAAGLLLGALVLADSPQKNQEQDQQRYCTSRWATYQTKQPDFASVNSGNQQKRKMRVENTAAEPLDFFWIDPDGSEVAMTKLAAGRKFTMMCAPRAAQDPPFTLVRVQVSVLTGLL